MCREAPWKPMSDDFIYRAIKHLREELRRVDYVIQSLESIAEGKPRRGRPPKFVTEFFARQGEPEPEEKKRRGRPKRPKD